MAGGRGGGGGGGKIFIRMILNRLILSFKLPPPSYRDFKILGFWDSFSGC